MKQVPTHIAPVLARAKAAFRARFAGEPRWAAAAPGRVNLIGEHTDYNGGFVLPIAIDRVCIAVGGPGVEPGLTRVYSADLDQIGGFDARGPILLKNPATDIATGIDRGSWLSYVAGVLAGFQRGNADGGLPRNLDIAIASSVPVGSGLSSSASIEVAAATLLEQATSVSLGPKAKALLCQRAEHEFAGVPCGIMDQFISVMGRENHALLIDCRSQQGTLVPMPPPDRAVVVVMNTNIRHELAGGEYAKRRATCDSAAGKLGVPELRDADVRALSAGEGRLSVEELRRARHIITENARTLAAAGALRAGDLSAFGRLMLESHASLRDDYEVSCTELDTLVDLAMRIPGVLGARMTGGGFGGCAIALSEPGIAVQLAQAVADGYRRVHGRECSVSVVTASGGAAALPM